MQISEIRIRNIKSIIDSEWIQLSPKINVLIGKNNSGKSIFIKSLYQLQNQKSIEDSDIRVGEKEACIEFRFNYYDHKIVKIQCPHEGNLEGYLKNFQYEDIVRIKFSKGADNKSRGPKIYSKVARPCLDVPFLAKEPDNYIYPLLSKRKFVNYNVLVSQEIVSSVDDTFNNIIGKVDNLTNPSMLAHRKYQETCNNILGFDIFSYQIKEGKNAGYFYKNTDSSIPINLMGDGTLNIIEFLVYLCVAENKLFLIEEPENDIYPEALKKLLNLIIEKSANNQFIITTHSNIVMKYLGSEQDSKIFHLTLSNDSNIPKTSIREVGSIPEERRSILEELGYDLFDYNIWSAWLLLEESSAEYIIRDCILPWFFSHLSNKLRTVAAGGICEIEPKFNDFNRLFLYLHQESIYKNRAWVFVDGDDIGKETIRKLKGIYSKSGWNQDNFRTFSKENFEKYYPDVFDQEKEEIFNEKNRDKKRDLKKQLIEKVKCWIVKNSDLAKEKFKDSASEIIELVKLIDKSLKR